MARRGSSKRWLRERREDPFVTRATREGFRARSAYKLVEIDEKDDLLRPGMHVVDLGAAPGAWSQYIVRRVGAAAQANRAPKGSVIALDILAMDPIAGVTFVQGDFRTEEVLARLLSALGDDRVDLVVSDMAPNMAGIRAADQARSMDLAELALAFACATLRPGGDFLVKVFQGEGIDPYRQALKAAFTRLMTRKPEASRDRSRELYLLARGFRGCEVSQ